MTLSKPNTAQYTAAYMYYKSLIIEHLDHYTESKMNTNTFS